MLVSLHWLRSPKGVMFKVAMLIYKAIHGSAPTRLVRVADLPGCRCLCSERSNYLLVPSVRLSTVGGRAFPVAGPSIWNNLLDNMTSAPTLYLPPATENLSVLPLLPWRYTGLSGSWSYLYYWTTLKFLTDWQIDNNWKALLTSNQSLSTSSTDNTQMRNCLDMYAAN